MSWKALDTLLLTLQQQPSWEAHRQYQRLLQVWEKVVDPPILAVTKPFALRRQVFWVATITPVWAQTLTLQRYPLLKTLNSYLDQPLLDLRFSSVQGYQLQNDSASTSSETVNPPQRPQPVIASSLNLASPSPPPKTPMEAFQRWARVLQARAEQLPACPRCQSPTLPQDLQRWSVCSSCVRQRWHRTDA